MWSTIWGKVVTKICDEILCNGGIEADTKLQRHFRNRFRMPFFSMFETMVMEFKDANIFRRGVQVTRLSAHSRERGAL